RSSSPASCLAMISSTVSSSHGEEILRSGWRRITFAASLLLSYSPPVRGATLGRRLSFRAISHLRRLLVIEVAQAGDVVLRRSDYERATPVLHNQNPAFSDPLVERCAAHRRVRRPESPRVDAQSNRLVNGVDFGSFQL